MTAGGSLSLPGQVPTSKEQAQELILEFKELSAAQRDNATLNALENSLLSLQLEKARQSDPELISAPTLIDSPVGPSKKHIMAIGLLGGFMLSCFVALIKDRRSNLVFNTDELRGFLPCPLLTCLPAMAMDKWTDAADLIASGPLSDVAAGSTVALIPLGALPSEQLQAFSSELRRALNDRELIVSTDLRETSRCATQLLITSPGVSKRTQIAEFCQKLALQGVPVLAGCYWTD